MKKKDYICIRGAKEHNLKNIDLKIPRNTLTVVTGLSGSGKSSLAFDTIYAEGQRRYVESLSSYARQFLEQLSKPHVEYIEGLSPAISIQQRSLSTNPRSIVATQTELYDYLRVLFARAGIPFCFKCGQKISPQTSSKIISQVKQMPIGSKIIILAPLVRGKRGRYEKMFEELRKEGFVRVRVDGRVVELDEQIDLEKDNKHNIELVVDRIIWKKKLSSRLSDSIETALRMSGGLLLVVTDKLHPKAKKSYENLKKKKDTWEILFSQKYACPKCGVSYGEIEPRNFSFNSPYGACEECNGLGRQMSFDSDLVIPDKTKSLEEGAIEPWQKGGKGYILYYKRLLWDLSEELGFSMDTSFGQLPKNIQRTILYGGDVYLWGKKFEGVIPNLERIFKTTTSEYRRSQLSNYMSRLPCSVCGGARLKKESLSVKIDEKSIWDILLMSVKQANEFFFKLKLDKERTKIAELLLKEIRNRLRFCVDVGLGYLTLDRESSTLSGGEAQRIRLATQVGSGLVGVIYILDEPTIGLHQKDNTRLLSTLNSLRDIGNTLVVVEHDEQTILNADYIIDLGPGAGREGGYVVYAGDVKGIKKNEKSLTGRYLLGIDDINLPEKRRICRKKSSLLLKGAKEHNLKNIDVMFPLGTFICITGVSGSGKSTLVSETLFRALHRNIYGSGKKPGKFKRIEGLSFLDKVIEVNQDPIGRTPRSNPTTYSGVFAYIRELFSKLPEAKVRGYRKGRFSFNVKGGRCEACQGQGYRKVSMHFLADVYVECSECKGARFNKETLQVKYKGYSIADVLGMTVDESRQLFANIPPIMNILNTLSEVGLGYIQLGQSATTLSGGEAQRLKLASQLRKKATGKTMYFLDEPTTGLHFADIEKLINVLQKLVDKGNTVIVVEHNLDVIKCSDYVIDLGPEGGDLGGNVVAHGSPEELIKSADSYTGKYLKSKISA